MDTFYDIVKNRRSFYQIGKDIALSEERIVEIIHHAVKYAPSAFNSQSGRIIVLFRGEHDKLWNLTRQILQGIVPPNRFAPTEEKLRSFQAGYGTLLFFEDQDTVTGLQNRFPLYKDNFPIWSLQSSGMLQFILWTALESEGLGANLQHYNPLIDEKVHALWEVPESWRLMSQMPFGSVLAPPDEKTFIPVSQRVKVY